MAQPTECSFVNDVCGGWEQQLGPHQWPGASGSHPRAEQRESKLVGEVGVCAKALQQRDVLLGTTRCHFPGFAHTFGLDPWIADGRGG